MSRATGQVEEQAAGFGRPADFSPAGYRALLQAFRSAGYRSADFHSVVATEPHLVLRHDVDLSLDEAAAIAEIDAAEKWPATVFILLASEFYNPFTQAGRAALRHIIGLGHEIGLHFDGSVYNDGAPPSDFTPELEAAAGRECETLASLVGAPIRTIAFHRPRQSPWVLRRPGRFAGRLHAYAPEFMSDIAYVADSAGYWSEGHPLEHRAFHQRSAMQVNTHPYLWTQAPGLDRVEKIDRVRGARAKFLQRETQRNFSFYPR